jgi:hypothetical protein
MEYLSTTIEQESKEVPRDKGVTRGEQVLRSPRPAKSKKRKNGYFEWEGVFCARQILLGHIKEIQ